MFGSMLAREAVASRGQGACVTDIALEFGFNHFGRFAQSYARAVWREAVGDGEAGEALGFSVSCSCRPAAQPSSVPA